MMLQSVSGTNRRWFLQTLVSHSLVPITVPNRATREFNASRTLDAHWLEALEHLSDVIMTHARRQRRARTMEQFTKTCAVVKEVRARNEKKRCEPAPVKLIPSQVKRCSFPLKMSAKPVMLARHAHGGLPWRSLLAGDWELADVSEGEFFCGALEIERRATQQQVPAEIR